MPPLKLAVFFILVIGFEFMHFDPQLINKKFDFINLAPDSVNFSPCIHVPFTVWSLILDFFIKSLIAHQT
jgi:hypothetical protein